MSRHATRCSAGRIAILVLGVSLSANRAHAKRPPVPTCPPGRFLVQGGHSLLSGAVSSPIEALTLTASRTLAITSGCPAVAAKLKGTKHGTQVVSTWPAGACAGLKGRVRLAARIDVGCQTMHGRLRAKKLRRPFVAQLSRCGDGILDRDGGEQCDLLEGDPSAPALGATFDLPPVEVDQSQIENGIIMTRLDVRFAPGATISQVNNALGLVGGGIVTMTQGLPFVTIAVPRPPSLAALRQLAQTLNLAPGILWAFVGGPSEPQVLPFAASAFPNRNLLPTRFPAAWNTMQLAVRDCDTRKVSVLVADDFIRGAGITLPFGDEVPTFRLLPLDSNGGSTHGYDVTTTMAALFNDRNPTGANPFTQCLTITGVQLEGLEPSQELFRIVQHFPVGQRFILNFSRAFTGRCVTAFEATSGVDICEDESVGNIPTAYERAAWAEEWKRRTSDQWDKFLVTPAAGNFRGDRANPEGFAATIYPGLGIARFTSALNIVTDADPFFGFISNTGLWQPNVSDPDLTATPDEVARLRTAIESDGLEEVGRAENVVITGSSAPGDTFVDLLESAFSNIDPDVVAVGENIPTLGPVGQGTSFAAPQVAGLASYLWLLSNDLRNNQPISVTRRAILDNARELPLAGRVIDAYAAVLSLDAAALPTPSSAPIRLTILDLNNDERFDERDISAFLGLFLDSNGDPVQPTARDYLRFDLNGDGFTGGSNTERFDLDRAGSTQYGATNYAPVVTQDIEGSAVSFDSNAVTDLQILCYYAYSDLYQGDPDARSGLLAGHCGQGATTTAKVEALAFDGQGTVGSPVTKEASGFSAFAESVEAFDDLTQGRSAEAEGTQDTAIDSTEPNVTRVHSSGAARASWADADPGDGADPAGAGTSEFKITLEVTGGPVGFTLTGSATATADVTNSQCTTVSVTSPSGATFDFAAPAGCESSGQSIDDSGELGVGTHIFSVVAHALASNPDATGGSAQASFDLSLTFGGTIAGTRAAAPTSGAAGVRTIKVR